MFNSGRMACKWELCSWTFEKVHIFVWIFCSLSSNSRQHQHDQKIVAWAGDWNIHSKIERKLLFFRWEMLKLLDLEMISMVYNNQDTVYNLVHVLSFQHQLKTNWMKEFQIRKMWKFTDSCKMSGKLVNCKIFQNHKYKSLLKIRYFKLQNVTMKLCHIVKQFSSTPNCKACFALDTLKMKMVSWIESLVFDWKKYIYVSGYWKWYQHSKKI